MSRPREPPEDEQITAKKLLAMKQQLNVPDPVWKLVKTFAGEGRETEPHARMFFENVSKNMVKSAQICPHRDGTPQFRAEWHKLMHAFETRRDRHREYGGHWAPYVNSPLELWKRDYLLVWDDYIHGRLG